MNRFSTIIIAIYIFYNFPGIINAQSNQIDAFSFLSVKLNIIQNRSSDELNHLWTGNRGYEGIVQMPFYFGDIQGGLRYIPYKAKEQSYNDFSSYYYFLGWGKEFNLPLNCSFYTGFKFGGYSMSFHNNSLTIEQRSEREFAEGINSYLAVKFFNNFKLIVGADYTKVFTFKQIELFLLSAGISYTFQSPAWLKDILN